MVSDVEFAFEVFLYPEDLFGSNLVQEEVDGFLSELWTGRVFIQVEHGKETGLMSFANFELILACVQPTDATSYI